MAAQIPSNASAILLAIVARLGTTPFTDDLVFPVNRLDEEPDFLSMADGILLLRLRGGLPVAGRFEAAGRVDAEVERRLTVRIWSRCVLDEPTRQIAWLTDSALGHLVRENSVLNLLDGFQVEDSSRNWLTTHPMKLIGIGDTKPHRTQTDWGHSDLEFELAYQLDLDQNYQ